MNHPVFTGAQFAPDPFCVIVWLKWSQLRVLFVVCQLALAKAVGIADKMYNGCDVIWFDVMSDVYVSYARSIDKQATKSGKVIRHSSTYRHAITYVPIFATTRYQRRHTHIYLYNYIVRIHVFSGCNRIHTSNWYLGCSPLVFSGGSQPVTAICCFQ